jgi:hypothetical protein
MSEAASMVEWTDLDVYDKLFKDHRHRNSSYIIS